RCTHRGPRVAHGCGAADDLRRRADQAVGPRACVRGRCGSRRVRTCAVWADDAATGHGRAGRAATTGGAARRPRESRRRVGAGLWGVVGLVGVGLVMTGLMQSSSAAIALTLSAHYAGAIGLDQGCALIIGQNIGTATSSAMAAIGASTTAKRLALAYILFKLIAAAIALVLFPVIT